MVATIPATAIRARLSSPATRSFLLRHHTCVRFVWGKKCYSSRSSDGIDVPLQPTATSPAPSPGGSNETTIPTPTILVPQSLSAARHFTEKSTRAEVLSLYRFTLRTTNAFHWCYDDGSVTDEDIAAARYTGRGVRPSGRGNTRTPPTSKKAPWRDRLRQSARKEFEEARHEKDPLVIARLLVVGGEAVEEVRRRIAEADGKIRDRIISERNER